MINSNEKYFQVLEVLQELEKLSIYQFGSEESLVSKKSYTCIDLDFLKHQIFEKKISDFKITSNFENTIYADQMIAFVHNWLLTNTLEKTSEKVDPIQHFIISQIKNKEDN